MTTPEPPPAPRLSGDARGIVCDLVLPCRDEGPALATLLPRVPACFETIVVDNGSTDDTAEVAQRLGARVIWQPVPGYGAAVHAGILTARHDFVAVMDGDGSFEPADLLPLLTEVLAGRADLAVGRRRPVEHGVWPTHARVGNAVVLWWLRHRTGLRVHDVAPMRICRRDALLALEVRDRRCGYPVELLQRAHESGWRLAERDVAYHPRAPGTRSKISGSMRGSFLAVRDFAKVLA